MRKYLSILIAAALFLSVLLSFNVFALAADDVEFSVTPVPHELSKGSNVEFRYKIYNDSETEYTNCAIYFGDSTTASTDYFNLSKDGGRSEDVFTMKVEDSMLDVPLTFYVKSQNGEVLATTQVTVEKKTEINLKATITPNRTMAAKGDTVKLTVKLENQGNVEVRSIKVSASGLNDGSPFRDPANLLPGQHWNFEYSFIMGDADITFTPTISYSANDTAQSPIQFDPITIVRESPGVELSVDASNKNPNPGEEVTFTLTIANNGNISYKDMGVSLNGESESFPSKRLRPGDSFSATYKRSFDVSTDVIFTVTLTNHMGELKSVSSTVTIRLPVDTDTVNENLKLSITADRLELTSAGVVNFSGYVHNSSEYALTEVRVDEAGIGNIFSTPLLNPGERQNIQWPQDINETTDYNFVLTAADADGNAYNITADPITVTILSSAEPSPDFEDAVTLPPTQNDIGTTGVLLIIAGVLVLLIIGVGVALIVLWQKGRSPSGGRLPRKKTAARKRPVSRNHKSYRDRNNF